MDIEDYIGYDAYEEMLVARYEKEQERKKQEKKKQETNQQEKCKNE